METLDSVKKEIPDNLNITNGFSAVLGQFQLDFFQVKEFPGYQFGIISGGLSFGLGMGIINEGKIKMNQFPSASEKMRESLGINYLATAAAPIIVFLWFLWLVSSNNGSNFKYTKKYVVKHTEKVIYENKNEEY